MFVRNVLVSLLVALSSIYLLERDIVTYAGEYVTTHVRLVEWERYIR